MTKPAQTQIGKKLRQLRLSKGLTQIHVAEKLNITRSTISNYEIGRRTPHLKDLQTLAAFYHVGLDYFGIGEKDEAFDVLSRVQEIFESKEIKRAEKEELYHEFMKIYLKMQAS